jgi:hypothetical protein
MGTVQVTHAHPENSTASHHTCSICATAHAGVSTQAVTLAPVLTTTIFTAAVANAASIFRPAVAQFIRPPPAL